MRFPFNNSGFLNFLAPLALGAAKGAASGGLAKAAGSLLGNFAGSAASGVGSAVGGALGGKLSDKITGVPSALSASEQGAQAASYMDAAYPGTTAWDRLGAGGGGSPSALSASNVERMKMKQENKMQSRALTTQAMIADRQNRAHLISTASGYGIEGIKQVLNAYSGFKQSPFDNPTSQAGKRLPSEIERTQAETKSKQYGPLTPLNTMFNLDSAKKQAPHVFKNIKNAFNFSIPKFDDNGRKIPSRFQFSPIRNSGASGKY